MHVKQGKPWKQLSPDDVCAWLQCAADEDLEALGRSLVHFTEDRDPIRSLDIAADAAVELMAKTPAPKPRVSIPT